MQRIVIFGAGGLGTLVHDLISQAPDKLPVAFLDSDATLHGSLIEGLPVLGGLDALGAAQRLGATHAIVAVGENQQRMAIADEIERSGMPLVSAIHGLASIAPSARLGKHVIIGPRAVVCVHARVGDHVVLSAGAIVDHENSIGNGAFVHAAARLAGGVEIDSGATIGIGACVIQYRKIGARARVAPGAVVIRNVGDGESVGGVPALPLAIRGGRFVPDSQAAAPPQAVPA